MEFLYVDEFYNSIAWQDFVTFTSPKKATVI
jgi:hypothetical protein